MGREREGQGEGKERGCVGKGEGTWMARGGKVE